LGAIVAQQLHTNRSKGVIYGGIYAFRLARHFRMPIRHEEDELLPTKYLDYDSMVEHNFIDSGRRRFWYNLVFSQGTREIITLPAPALFDHSRGRYTITPKDIYAYWGLTPPPAPALEPTYQWKPQEPQHHPGSNYFQPWP
jgi:hypothetical protein